MRGGGEVGRRRTGEENLPNEGGLNKRNGIDNRRLTFGFASIPLGPLLFRSAPHPALIDELCKREATVL